MIYLDNAATTRPCPAALDAMRTALEGLDGPPTADFVKHLLSGRYGFLCQYDRAAGRDTVWSAACDLTRRRCLLAEGNPGRTAFREIPFPVERGDSRPCHPPPGCIQ